MCGGDDEGDEDDDEEDILANLLDELLSFFFSASRSLSSILWWPTFVEFKLTGMMHLQRKPKTEQIIILPFKNPVSLYQNFYGK